MKAGEKNIHCLILFAILPLAQCVAFVGSTAALAAQTH
jgi:hypothetical protein